MHRAAGPRGPELVRPVPARPVAAGARVHRARRAGVVAVARRARGRCTCPRRRCATSWRGSRSSASCTSRTPRPGGCPPTSATASTWTCCWRPTRRQRQLRRTSRPRLRQSGSSDDALVDGLARAVAHAEVRQLRVGAGQRTDDAAAHRLRGARRAPRAGRPRRPRDGHVVHKVVELAEPVCAERPDAGGELPQRRVRRASRSSVASARRWRAAPGGPRALRPADGARADAGVEHAARTCRPSPALSCTACRRCVDEATPEEGALPIAALRTLLVA